MAENYENLYYNEDEIRLKVLTNICRMMTTRGYMDIEKYRFKNKDEEKKDKNDNSTNTVLRTNDLIDESLFLPLIKKRSDNNVYIIPLDKPYRDRRESKAEANAEFDGSTVVVKLIHQVVKDVGNSPILNDFFKIYNDKHKIVVFDGMADKVYNTLSRKKNVEVFDRDYLMIDLMHFEAAPLNCNLITYDDINYIINPAIAKINRSDPLTRYYDGDKGEILRVERSSLNNSIEIGYRKII